MIVETDAAAEEAIRAGVDRWVQMIKAKDAAGIAQLYAEDAVAMPPNQPIVSGRDAIQEYWRAAVQIPELSLTFEPRRIDVSSSGDMAIDRGTYRLTARPEGQAVDESGKYVEVWRKVGNTWKVAANIYNSDTPPFT